MENFSQLPPMYQFKLKHLFKRNYLALALWYSGEYESLGFVDQEQAILWLANKIGSHCMFNTKQTMVMLMASPLCSDLYMGFVEAVVEESKPIYLGEKCEQIVMCLATKALGLTFSEIRKYIKTDRGTLRGHLSVLIEKDLVVKQDKLYRLKASRLCLRYLNYLRYNYLAFIYINTKFSPTLTKSKQDGGNTTKNSVPNFTEAQKKRVRKVGRLLNGHWTHFTEQPPVNPYTDWHDSFNVLLPNGKIHIDPQGVKFFDNELSIKEYGEMKMLVDHKIVPGEPTQVYTDWQLEVSKFYIRPPKYRVAEYLNSQHNTNFDTTEIAEYYRLRCPFHGGDSLSFYVYADGHYYCYHGACNAKGGRLLDLEMKLHTIDLSEALDVLEPFCIEQTPWDKPGENYGPGQIAGFESQRKRTYEVDLQGAKDFYNGIYIVPGLKPNWQEADTPTASYLFGRGFTASTLEHFHVHDLYNLDKRYPIWVPLVENECVYGSMRRAVSDDVKPKYLTLPGTPKSHHFYGEMRENSVPLIVEGITDAWACWQYGASDFGALLGSSISDVQAAFLFVKKIKAVVVATDMDKAGEAAYKMMKEKLERNHIAVYRFIYQAKDIALMGRNAFEDALQSVLSSVKTDN